MKRKSSVQLQALESFYEDEKYPTQMEMKGYAAALGLTLKQVKGWFAEKRRRDKRANETLYPIHSMKKLAAPKERNAASISAARRNPKGLDLLVHNRSTSGAVLYSRYKSTSLVSENRYGKKKNKMLLPQDLLSPQYILKKVFRKDGPPLGVEFDSLPSQACFHNRGFKDSHPADQDCQREATKRRKVPELTTIDYQNNGNESAPVKKHGIGKGLMTVWRVVNPEGGDIPTGVDFSDRQIVASPPTSSPAVRRQPPRNKRRQPLVSLMKQRRLEKKLQEKRRHSIKRREVQSKKDDNHRQPHKEKCELALDGSISNERLDLLAMLVDDEELELRELQAGTNPLTCSDHLGTSGVLGCALCKDLLAKFPPNSVKMKQPFSMPPWDSSPETVKKLFKVFHFLYTYSVTLDICSFTLDEFAQAFHDKDSLLLGKIHVALLKLLLSDVQAELSGALLPHFSLPCKFLALLHSVENKEFVVEFWKTSLNPLTWAEILRQVLIAAGFGSTLGLLRREAFSKEMSLMARYGLRPGSLKGELFKILSERGNNGLKVSDLALSLPITELNLTSTTEELEELICSTLSSDITLFEKISSSAYRLRCSSVAKDGNDCHSDTEDSGSVDDDSDDSSDDSECDSGDYYQRKLKHKNHYKSKNNMLTVYTEIDESHPGEVWLLGLMEGEYSDLSIEEKLNALVALIDLLSAGSSIRMENPCKAVAEYVPNIPHYGSGAKIKGSSSNRQNMPRPSWVYGGQKNGVQEAHTSSDSPPVDSSLISKYFEKEKCSSGRKDAKETEVGVNIHPMQSVFLGSDRRYNRYWLFLGPCNAYDPGHRRIYFESSEDGHWEVIDNEEALRALLAVLDDRGKREAVLIESLEKREAWLCQKMSSRHLYDARIRFMPSDSSEMDVVREDSSPVSDVDNLSLTVAVNDSLTSCGAIILEAGKKGEELNQKWRRLQEFDVWIWDCFYLNLNAVKHSRHSYLDSLTRCESCHDLYWRDEKHCRICHTTFELDFDLEERYAIHVATCREKGHNSTFPKFKVLPSQLQSLKAAVHAIESVMPEDALIGAWTKSAHRLWVKRLRRTSSLSELLQVVADFVAAISENWLNQCHIEQGGCTVIEEIIAFFPTMPQTSSAVALWLVKLDEFIAPYLKKVQSEKELENRTICSDRRARKE